MSDAREIAKAKRIRKQIDDVFAEKGFHPSGETLLAMLHDEKGNWQKKFSEDDLDELAEFLRKVKDDEGMGELHRAVLTALSFAQDLNEKPASKEAGMMLFAAANMVIHQEDLVADLEERKAEKRERKKATKKLTGSDAAEDTKSAPELGEEPAEGSVSLSALNPKRRI